MSNLFKLLVALVAGLSLVLWAGEDRGLGGTGKYANEDRGLGGTGVIGTITEFGSIWVNGLEIELDENTDITLDGVEATEDALRLGQQVAVLAKQRGDLWFADSIQIRHALIGVVEAVDESGWTIQGVTVTKAENAPQALADLAVGDFVKVSGYFSEGALYATDVQVSAESDGEWQLHGPVTVNADGVWQVANVVLPEAMQEAIEGEWVTLKGRVQDRVATPYFIKHDDLPFIDEADQYLIEVTNGRSQTTRIETLTVDEIKSINESAKSRGLNQGLEVSDVPVSKRSNVVLDAVARKLSTVSEQAVGVSQGKPSEGFSSASSSAAEDDNIDIVDEAQATASEARSSNSSNGGNSSNNSANDNSDRGGSSEGRGGSSGGNGNAGNGGGRGRQN